VLRVVYPWRGGGHLIGYLELGKEFIDIAQIMHGLLNAEMIVSIEKNLLDRGVWEKALQKYGKTASWDEFPSVVIMDKTIQDIPPALSHVLFAQAGKHQDHSFTTPSNGRVFQVIIQALKGLNNQQLGDLIVLRDVSSTASASRNCIIHFRFRHLRDHRRYPDTLFLFFSEQAQAHREQTRAGKGFGHGVGTVEIGVSG
jgi:hypothetical protein